MREICLQRGYLLKPLEEALIASGEKAVARILPESVPGAPWLYARP
jgi:hypothetical protein